MTIYQRFRIGGIIATLFLSSCMPKNEHALPDLSDIHTIGLVSVQFSDYYKGDVPVRIDYPSEFKHHVVSALDRSLSTVDINVLTSDDLSSMSAYKNISKWKYPDQETLDTEVLNGYYPDRIFKKVIRIRDLSTRRQQFYQNTQINKENIIDFCASTGVDGMAALSVEFQKSETSPTTIRMHATISLYDRKGEKRFEYDVQSRPVRITPRRIGDIVVYKTTDEIFTKVLESMMAVLLSDIDTVVNAGS